MSLWNRLTRLLRRQPQAWGKLTLNAPIAPKPTPAIKEIADFQLHAISLVGLEQIADQHNMTPHGSYGFAVETTDNFNRAEIERLEVSFDGTQQALYLCPVEVIGC